MMYAPTPLRLGYQFGMHALEMQKNIHDVQSKFEALSHVKKVDVCDIIPLLCMIKNSVVSTVQLTQATQASQVDQKGFVESKPVESIQATISDMWKNCRDNLKSTKQKIVSVLDTAKTVGIIDVQSDSCSLLDVNTGIDVGFDGHSTSGLNINNGISAFVNSNTIDACYGMNYGMNAVRNFQINTMHNYVDKGSCYGASGVMKAQQLNLHGSKICMIDNLSLEAEKHADIDTSIETANVKIQAETTLLSGSMNAQNGDIKTDNLALSKKSKLKTKHLNVHANHSIDHEGDMHVDNVQFKSKKINVSGSIDAQTGYVEADDVVTHEASTLNIKNLMVKVKDSIDHNGKIYLESKS